MKHTVYFCLAMAGLSGISGCSSDGEVEQYTTKVWSRGAALNAAVSLNFNPNGEMFAIDAFSSRILKMDQNSGQVLDIITDSVDGAADFDFAIDGTMYWVLPFSGKVYRRTTSGVVSLVANLNTVIDGVTVNAENRVFTASFASSKDALWELDPFGIIPPRVVVQLGGFDAFDFGPDGYLYAPDYSNGTGQIYKINVDTGEVKVIADGFCQPISAKFNSIGELYILDALCPQMVKVNIYTGEKTLVANLEPGVDNFDFNPQDEMFVAFNANSYIGKLNPDGSVTKITRSGFASPGGVVIRADDSLFVSGVFAMRRFDLVSGESKKTVYTNDGMIPALSLSGDGQNLIITSNLFGGMVQIWNPDTGVAVETHANFKQPTNAIRFQDNIVVADMGIGSVVKLTDRTPLIEGLKVPAGLAAKGNDLYVGDWKTGIIWKVVEAGVVLNPARIATQNLVQPEGIAFDNEGKLLVVEVGKKRLLRIDLETNTSFVVAQDLEIGLTAPEGATPTWVAMSSVAVSKSGTLYVTGDVGNVIYEIKPGVLY